MKESEKIARAAMTIFKMGVHSAKRYISYIDDGINPIYAIDDLPGYSFSFSPDYLAIYVWMDTDEGGQYKGRPILKVLPAAMVDNSNPDYKKDRDKVMKLLEYQAWVGL